MSTAHWQAPLTWNEDARKSNTRFRVFCASMADVFEEAAPDGELERLWNLIRATPFLDWQLLTKRPERIFECLPADWGNGYPNVWLGTSVEDERVTHRINQLRQVPSTVRFLSLEPLIGPLANLQLDGIDWVIVGGESGPGARPIEEEWILEIKNQCRREEVAFFFKQWGGVNKKKAGRLLQGRVYDELPIPAAGPLIELTTAL